jgi:hypothetical protein
MTDQMFEPFIGFFPKEFHRRHVRRWLELCGFREFAVREYAKILNHLQGIRCDRGREQEEQLKDALAEIEVAYSLAEAGIQLIEYHPKAGNKIIELLCAAQAETFYVEVKRIRLSENEQRLHDLQERIRTAVSDVESQYLVDVCLWPVSWDCRDLFECADEIVDRCAQIVAQVAKTDPHPAQIGQIQVTVNGQELGRCFVCGCPEKETTKTLCIFGAEQGPNRRGNYDEAMLMRDRLVLALPQVVVGHTNVVAFVQGSGNYHSVDMDLGLQMVNTGIRLKEEWLLKQIQRRFEGNLTHFADRWESLYASMFFGWSGTTFVHNPLTRINGRCDALADLLTKCKPAYRDLP